jgi:hypothetical protein
MQMGFISIIGNLNGCVLNVLLSADIFILAVQNLQLNEGTIIAVLIISIRNILRNGISLLCHKYNTYVLASYGDNFRSYCCALHCVSTASFTSSSVKIRPNVYT